MNNIVSEYWERRESELALEYMYSCLNDQDMFVSAMRENNNFHYSFARALLHAKRRGFPICACKDIDSRMNKIAELYGAKMASEQVAKEKSELPGSGIPDCAIKRQAE